MGTGFASGPPPGALIERKRLLERLLGARVGLVEAGAGYGKSVFGAQYRHRLGAAAAYVPLGPPDADSGVLVGSIRRAAVGPARRD